MTLGFGTAALAQAPGAPRGLPVEAAAATSDTLDVELTAVGSLFANESVVIRPEIIGRIAEIHFEDGQWVEQGDPLVTLDQATYRARVAESEANLRLAELSFERSNQLLQKNLGSRQQFDEDAARLAQARAELAVTKEQLAKTVLKAPFVGKLGLRRVSPGDFVQAGQDIVNLEDIRSLKLDFQVPETYLTQVEPGLILRVRSDAVPDETFAGKVYAVSPRLDTASRSVLLRARVDNPNGRLRPGLFVRVKLRIAHHENAVLIPEEALWPIGERVFVYRVADGKAELTPVTTGFRRPGEVEITEGVAAGDVVVIGGQMKLRSGAPVVVVNQPSKPE